MTAQHNSLSHSDRFKLYDWLKKNKKLIHDQGQTIEQGAALATTQLAFSITVANIEGITKKLARNNHAPAVPIDWYKSRKRASVGEMLELRGQIRLLFMAIDDQNKAMGHRFEGELGTLWELLAKKVI